MKFFLLTVFMCIFSVQSVAFCIGISTDKDANTATFWQKKDADNTKVVLSREQIYQLNKSIIFKTPTVVDLSTYPSVQTTAKVKSMLLANKNLLDDQLYINGHLLSENYKKIITSELNISALLPSIPVQYGVTILRSNLRAMPTNSGWFESSVDKHFDQLQLTAVDPSEPVVILHKSKNGNFYFVQMRNYAGWLPVWQVAKTSKDVWLKFVKPNQFLVVTADKFILKANGKNIVYQMGAKIPVVKSYTDKFDVLVPELAKDGSLEQTISTLLKSSNYNLGFLPYTKNNILQQAFKFLNAPYDWGGWSKNSVDCSSFIANVYRTVGVELPRDADIQEKTAGKNFVLTNLDTASRQTMFSALRPGDVLFMPGHTMLYLGKINNDYYAIHSLGSHYINGQRDRVMKVVVSDLNLKNANGKTFFNNLTSAMSYR